MYTFIKVICCSTLLLFSSYLWGAGINPYPSEIKIKFYNVGQGNCTLVVPPKGPPLLVDFGSTTYPRIDPNTHKFLDIANNEEEKIKLQDTIALNIKESVIKWRRERRRDKIKAVDLNVVISHADEDHLNWIHTNLSKITAVTFVIKKLNKIITKIKSIEKEATNANAEDYRNQNLGSRKAYINNLKIIINNAVTSISNATTKIQNASNKKTIIEQLKELDCSISLAFSKITKAPNDLLQQIKQIVANIKNLAGKIGRKPAAELFSISNAKTHFLLGGPESDYKKKSYIINYIETLWIKSTMTFSPHSLYIDCGPEVKCTILSSLITTDTNVNSMVLKIFYENKSVILTGDATDKTTHHIITKYQKSIQKRNNLLARISQLEKELKKSNLNKKDKDLYESEISIIQNQLSKLMKKFDINEEEPSLHTHILQASHHGAKSHGSNNPQWFEATRPEILVTSASIREDWKHPNIKIIKNFLSVDRTNAHQIHSDPNYWHNIHLGEKIKEIKDIRNLNNFTHPQFTPYIYFSGGYQIAYTNLGIYSTIDQGSITFSWEKDSQTTITTNFLSYFPTINISNTNSSHTPNNTVNPSMSRRHNPNLNNIPKVWKTTLNHLKTRNPDDTRGTLIGLNLTGLGLQNSDVANLALLSNLYSSSLLNLDLSNNPGINDGNNISNLLTLFPNLVNLNLEGTSITNQDAIRATWGNRGLQLP